MAALTTTTTTDTTQQQHASSERIVLYALTGNVVIFGAKLAAATYSGSSAMLSEAVHSAVDSGNQALLLVGLRSASRSPSALHPYGWGKSVYLWSLVSALGTFWLGGGVSAYSSACELVAGTCQTGGVECAAVLGISFAVDGLVLRQTWRQFVGSKPEKRTVREHLRKTSDPTVLAVLLEDAAACAGVTIAAAGIALSRVTGVAALDAASGLAVGVLLASVGAALATVNAKYLVGTAVDKPVLDSIERILRSRPAVEDVHSVQSTVVGPDAFSYKCEVDFDHNVLARRLAPRYEPAFLGADRKKLSRLLALYAGDVMTLLEAEVREAEQRIRAAHPTALFIEIEPDASAGFVLPDPSDDESLLDPPTKAEWEHIFFDDDDNDKVHLFCGDDDPSPWAPPRRTSGGDPHADDAEPPTDGSGDDVRRRPP